MKVRFSPTAREQVQLLSDWWDQHRPHARVRVGDALAAAILALTEHPYAGRPYAADPRYRTWRLGGTPYVLFYRVDEGQDAVWVAVVWSAQRGTGPELP